MLESSFINSLRIVRFYAIWNYINLWRKIKIKGKRIRFKKQRKITTKGIEKIVEKLEERY